MAQASYVPGATVMPDSRKSWWAVGILTALYVLSLVDRTILAMLIGPIKAEFALSDLQMGLLLGPSFGVVYSLLGVPFGRLADRTNRVHLIVAGVTLWCLSTIGSGFAVSFGVLLTLRLGLALGEASLSPAAYSMIGDLFPKEKKGLAASVYGVAGNTGGPIAFFAGAAAIQAIARLNADGLGLSLATWRIVLVVLGIPGLGLALLVALTVRDPRHAGVQRGANGAVPASAVLRHLLAHKRLFAGLAIGAAIPGGAGYGAQTWTVEMLKRDMGWTAVDAGWVYGLVALASGLTGALGAPWLSRWLRARGRHDAVLVVNLGCVVLIVLGLGLAGLQTNPWIFFPLLWLGLAAAFGAPQNMIVAMQDIAPPAMRGTLVASLLMILSLVGLGVGPVGVPLIAKLLGGSHSLGVALSLHCSICALLSVPPLLWARGPYERQSRLGFPPVRAD